MELIKTRPAGDVFMNLLGPDYNYEEKTITNSGTTAMVLDAGYPMDDNVPCLADGTAGADGMLVHPQDIPAGESVKAAVLARGPAVVNSSKLPATDYAGDAFTGLAATLAAALTTVVFRTEPTVQDEQET